MKRGPAKKYTFTAAVQTCQPTLRQDTFTAAVQTCQPTLRQDTFILQQLCRHAGYLSLTAAVQTCQPTLRQNTCCVDMSAYAKAGYLSLTAAVQTCRIPFSYSSCIDMATYAKARYLSLTAAVQTWQPTLRQDTFLLLWTHLRQTSWISMTQDCFVGMVHFSHKK